MVNGKRTASIFTAGAAVLALAACGTPQPPATTRAPAPAAAAPTPATIAPATPGMFVATPGATTGKTLVQWLGQSATRIITPGGKVIVIDPWLTSNPKTPEGYRNVHSLGKVDLILVTHAHADHYGDAPELAKLYKAPVYGPAGLNQSMVHLGVLPAELSPRFNKGGTITPLGAGIKITAVHAEHSSELTWRNPATGKDETHVGGEPVGFIIELENGFKIYHMGDTGLFGDMKLIGDYYKPDLVLIPIGGHFVMDPKDAAIATRDLIRPRYAIPIHYGTIPQLKGTPEEFLRSIGNSTIGVLMMKPGDALQF
ncbi:MAG TPA: metal-dependent hydrolase [Noviherbaspirillum sp.]|jgi:L-ascorbate metabolism protein UlaG (beta-lactamase superfamily)|uniref:metal-dependent hydrolase n=1 Tax=Noviherbaspirillum sp. TaxID=1926288 RepID=UPI002F936934